MGLKRWNWKCFMVESFALAHLEFLTQPTEDSEEVQSLVNATNCEQSSPPQLNVSRVSPTPTNASRALPTLLDRRPSRSCHSPKARKTAASASQKQCAELRRGKVSPLGWNLGSPWLQQDCLLVYSLIRFGHQGVKQDLRQYHQGNQRCLSKMSNVYNI